MNERLAKFRKETRSFVSEAYKFVLPAPKILYITMAMVYYAFYLFRPRFVKHYLKLDDAEYGLIMGLMAFVSFIFMTIWGTAADAFGRHRLLLAFAALSMAGVFLLFLIPISNDSLMFYFSALVLSIYSFFSSGILPLTDYQTIKLLEQKSTFDKDLYGRQRLWGTITYGLVSYLIGKLIKQWGEPVLFGFLSVSSVLFVIVLYICGVKDSPKPITCGKKKPANPFESNDKVSQVTSEMIQKEEKDHLVDNSDPSPVQEPSPKPTHGPVRTLLTNPNYLFLLVVVFMTGSARAVMTHFLAKYWDEKMDLDPAQVGKAAVSGIVFEVVILFFSPWFIHTIGIYWMLILSQLAMVARSWAYVIIPPSPKNVYLVYAVELLKGVAFGLTQSAGVKLSNEAAPPGLQATAQALYTSIYSQLPAVITTIAGGPTYKVFGPKVLFYATAVVSTIALALFIVKYTVDGSIRILCCFGKKTTDSKGATPHSIPT